jgi:hypothetical protein
VLIVAYGTLISVRFCIFVGGRFGVFPYKILKIYLVQTNLDRVTRLRRSDRVTVQLLLDVLLVIDTAASVDFGGCGLRLRTSLTRV